MSAVLSVRKFVHFEEEIRQENGQPVEPALSRIVVGAVAKNPLAGSSVAADIAPLVELSVRLGEILTTRALDRLGDASAIRAYGKAALIGTEGAVEHGAALIHPRLGMAMRATLRRGKVLIPGNAKVAGPGTPIDVIFGPLDEGWDLDAMDSLPVVVPDAPRSDELLLLVGYTTGQRPHARSKGPSQAEVDALIESFV
ncbi:amino acid synthesis family protein [Mycolicibacterium sp. YH-1]|uniref:amino acid synthesis family protein n=1 Tax=Mycolicibacterium sp. YH-1 TaxID=2908837 RepID=UPI001F4C2012|nr:amino acid synthesis family protein [Mycolicibacterium sp. YH-1]UNB52792.1 amino acid synthesis family protein [Mycolicibacterium sp. YH-1]